MHYRSAFRALFTVAILGIAASGFAFGQRLTDKQVRELMEGLDKDVERFNDAIDSQYRKSTIRSATNEVSVEAFTKDLKESCKKMRERFGSDYSASNEVLSFLKQAHAIEARAAAGGNLLGAEAEWPRLQGSLSRLGDVYGVDWKTSSANWAARRMNDRELEGAVSSLTASSETFKKSLEKALEKADVSKEERKAALDSTDRLVRGTKDLRKTVADEKDASGELGLIDRSTQDIRSVVSRHGLTSALASSWSPVEMGLQKVRSAFE